MRTKLNSAVFLLFLTQLSLVGCATAERSLRSQPAGYFPTGSILIDSGPIAGTKLICTQQRERKKTETESECLYFSADITPLIKKHLTENVEPATNRQLCYSLLSALLSISDYNCSSFLHRAFAIKSTFDGASKLIGDLASAISAGTVTAAPGVSAALDGLNLLTSKSNQTFDSTFYLEKTFSALESAIGAERAKRRADIALRKTKADYSLMDVLSDSKYYDDACSIKLGLQTLETLADNEQTTTETKKDMIERAPTRESAEATGQIPAETTRRIPAETTREDLYPILFPSPIPLDLNPPPDDDTQQ